jgi:ATP-binding cassette subfamily B protein
MNSFLQDLWKFFIPFLKPYKFKVCALAILPAIWCLIETAAPYLIKIIVDHLSVARFQLENEIRTLVYATLAYVSLIFALEFSIRLCHYLWVKTFPYIRENIQSKALQQTQTLSFQFLQDHFAGDLISKYRNLTESFEKIFSIFLYGLYPTILSFLCALIFIFFISPLFSSIFFLWFLAMWLVTLLYFKESVLASKEKSKVQNNLYGYVGNFICNPLSFIMFSQNIIKEDIFHNLIHDSIIATEKLEFITFKTDLWRSLLSWILLVCMMFSLSYGLYYGSITLGDFAFIGAICFYVRRTVWIASIQLLDFFKELGTAHEALSLISKSQKFKETSYTNTLLPSIKLSKSSLNIENISFSYDNQRSLFNNLTLHIPIGQKLGVIGPSGAGKTSFIHLLLGLYNPIQGFIKINNQDLRNLPIDQKRSLFSYAPQGASLLHRSVYDNIAFGKSDASPAEVYEAAKICLCDEFINSLSNGYETIIGEGGYKLSGGQRQRIAIARAYLKKAPIFILDEATSGLEASLEEKLLNRLCQNLKNHILIVISHRISSLKGLDRIIQLEEGKIVLDRNIR